MWLITDIGFFSIVQKQGDISAGTLTVRARVRSDLVALKEEFLPSLVVRTHRQRSTGPNATRTGYSRIRRHERPASRPPKAKAACFANRTGHKLQKERRINLASAGP